MKLRSIVCGSILLSLGAAAAAEAAPRWERPKREAISSRSGSFLRCSDDQIITAEDAKRRADWAYRCGLLDAEYWEFEFTHEPNPRTRGWDPLPADKRKYPIFVHDVVVPGNEDASYPVWHPNEASCDLPADVVYFDFCMNGCYRGDQRIAFEDGYEGIAAAEGKSKEGRKVLTLNEGSTFDAPIYQSQDIGYFTKSFKNAKEKMVTLKTADGQLVVTQTHPVVNQDGFMVSAFTLKAGDSLVKADGSLSEIQEVATHDFFGKVYNLAPVSMDAIPNIVVAEGFLNGSHRFQEGSLSAYRDVLLKRQTVVK